MHDSARHHEHNMIQTKHFRRNFRIKNEKKNHIFFGKRTTLRYLNRTLSFLVRKTVPLIVTYDTLNRTSIYVLWNDELESLNFEWNDWSFHIRMSFETGRKESKEMHLFWSGTISSPWGTINMTGLDIVLLNLFFGM